MKCENNEHIFRLSAEHGDVQDFVCLRCGQRDVKRGVFGVFFNKKYFGSLISGSTYQWKPFMDVKNIRQMSISFPGQPLIEFVFEEGQEKLSLAFDTCERAVDEEDRKRVCRLLSETDFSTWRTDPAVFDRTGYGNYQQNVFFTCTFAEHFSFLSYPVAQEADKLEEFKALASSAAEKYHPVSRSFQPDFSYLTTETASEGGYEEKDSDDRLHLYDSVNKEEHFLHGKRIRVGRDTECELPILSNNSFISRIHVTFVQHHGRWQVRDEYSKNGTWLNGQKLKPDNLYPLSPGDTVDLGHSVQLLFFVGSESGKST